VLTAVLVVTPLLIKHFTVRWLQENGGDQVRFQDVDLNPFTGKLVLKGLDIIVDHDTTLSFKTATAELAWAPLWHRQIDIQAVTLDTLSLVVDRQTQSARVGGIRLPSGDAETATEPAAENPWSAGIDTLSLNNIRVHYIDEQLDLVLALDHLQLTRLAQWSEQTPTPVEASGSLNDAPFTLSGEITPLAATPHYDITLKLDALQLAAFERLLQKQLGQLSGKLSYDGTLNYAQLADGFRVSQSGKLQLQALDVAVSQPALAIRSKDTQVNSELTLSAAGGDQQLKLKSDISLAGLAVNAAQSRLQLLRSAGLKLSNLDMSGVDRFSVQAVEADKLAFARRIENGDQEGPVDIDGLVISSLALSDNLLSIDSVKATGAHRQLQRDSKGNWVITTIIDDIKRLGETAEPAGEPATDAGTSGSADKTDGAAAAPAMAVAIGRIEIGGDSAISLLDQSIEPALHTKITVKTLLLESLDSRKPEQKSPVKFEASVGDQTSLSLQGDIQPLMQPPGADIASRISALDLPPLSPYAEHAMGLQLDSGSLDADISLKTAKDSMDGLIKLKLYQLELKNVASENSLQSQLPVPINVALDTLRDSNNTIDLKIPLKGDPANPDFNINDALTKALAGGVQKGALTYLTLALQPYGAMITAAKYAGEAVSKVRLKPVEFAAGQNTLDDTGRDYLSKVAKVLADRPKLAVKLCGVAVAQDKVYLQQQAQTAAEKAADKNSANKQPPAPPAISEQQLRALAETRAAGVRSYLVNNFKTPASHLVSCQPRVETGKDPAATPRTELLL
jgi:Domain of Unknown Function (DUF748)